MARAELADLGARYGTASCIDASPFPVIGRVVNRRGPGDLEDSVLADDVLEGR